MTNRGVKPFLEEVADELARAEAKFGPLNSYHEAYAVIKEELDEFWDECRKKTRDRVPEEVRVELIQIAAMAYRASLNLGLEPDR